MLLFILVEFLQEMRSSPAGDPAYVECVALQLDELCPGEICLVGHFQQIRIQIAPEVRRVIGIAGDFNTLTQ